MRHSKVCFLLQRYVKGLRRSSLDTKNKRKTHDDEDDCNQFIFYHNMSHYQTHVNLSTHVVEVGKSHKTPRTCKLETAGENNYQAETHYLVRLRLAAEPRASSSAPVDFSEADVST
jgi:hypothetical protein